MNWRKFLSLLLIVTLWVLFFPPFGFPQDELWKKIDEGLFLGDFTSQKISIVKIDPKYYSFKLLCASEKNRLRMTVKQWCQKHNLTSAINAGMFQADGITNVGYMKNLNHNNNPASNG
jgi:hypothetical protein